VSRLDAGATIFAVAVLLPSCALCLSSLRASGSDDFETSTSPCCFFKLEVAGDAQTKNLVHGSIRNFELGPPNMIPVPEL
jgi:hypothetical protein